MSPSAIVDYISQGMNDVAVKAEPEGKILPTSSTKVRKEQGSIIPVRAAGGT